MPHVLYIVTVDVSPAAEAAWNNWHTRFHMTEMLQQPGFVGARKYIEPSPLTDGWFRYVVFYELDSPTSLAAYEQSEAAQRIRADHEQRFGDVTRVARRILHEVGGLAARDPYEDL
jgi:antibiotic biosynthesis monooxygenase (ABM) superfamily enzyme